jgi:hypothetical protein
MEKSRIEEYQSHASNQINTDFNRTLWRQDSIKNRPNLSKCIKIGETVLQKSPETFLDIY